MSKFQTKIITKADIWNTIIEAFVEAGWEDVSSQPTAPVLDGVGETILAVKDYTMLMSEDNEGQKIFIQLRPMNAANQDIRTTPFTGMSARMVKGYTPGSDVGVAGIIENPGWTWQPLLWAHGTAASPTQIPLVTDNVKMYWNITKTRAIIAIRWNLNPAYLNTLGSWVYIGVSEDEIMDNNPRRGSFVVGSSTVPANVAIGIDYPKQYSVNEGIITINHPVKSLSPLKNPDLRGVFYLIPIYYESVDVGLRGKFDNLLYLPANVTNIMDGDAVVIKGAKYELLKVNTVTSNVIPVNAFICLEVL